MEREGDDAAREVTDASTPGGEEHPGEVAIRHTLGVESAYGFHIEESLSNEILLLPMIRVQEEGYPCLENTRYSGCLGADCPRETCWTGTPSISALRAYREWEPISTTLYLTGALCLNCQHAVEEEGGQDEARVAGEDRPLAAAPRIRCSQGRWRHAISAAAFVHKRIPMIQPDDPASCPSYSERETPHPQVAAHLARRRARAQQRRHAEHTSE